LPVPAAADERNELTRCNRKRYILQNHACFAVARHFAPQVARVDAQRAALVVLIEAFTGVDQFECTDLNDVAFDQCMLGNASPVDECAVSASHIAQNVFSVHTVDDRMVARHLRVVEQNLASLTTNRNLRVGRVEAITARNLSRLLNLRRLRVAVRQGDEITGRRIANPQDITVSQHMWRIGGKSLSLKE
jgi:hypothetical protein